ncbi:trehalose-6-phosphate synthase, partial [Cellulomonas sp. zg-ZUI222]|nr:trehalose-6-phosphate synthase [Cellulomonas wangleii]
MRGILPRRGARPSTRPRRAAVVRRVEDPGRTAAAFPISIDSHAFDQLARTEAVQRRAKEIRSELGDPEHLLLG